MRYAAKNKSEDTNTVIFRKMQNALTARNIAEYFKKYGCLEDDVRENENRGKDNGPC